ncbi:RteC domain-containing protein [Myroides injenensis]|uniref:RteC domain-containing protein n=1 Tax=Myroides injenensis TaxID=1183151 RepID=UPI00028A16E8|nr:RteC domain-containing protein [Myroides injenensis]
MEQFYTEILNKLETAIHELDIEVDSSLQQTEAIISTITQCLSEVKDYVLKAGFSDEDEEIRFFKHQKPVIVAKLIYYNAIYKIEAKRPYGGKKVIEDYLNKELSKLKRFFDNNMAFYSYYKTESTYLDHTYFVRGKHNVQLSLDTFYFETDYSFSTSHDYKVAKIISNDLIQDYLEDQLSKTATDDKLNTLPNLNWTGSKTALRELIYALHSQGIFNNGNADIKPIVKIFESTFNIDLRDFYHTFLELKSRKINRTKFLDTLKEALIRKMDEQDER